MRPLATPCHLLYDGERYHIVKEGGTLPDKLMEAWASGTPLPNAIRIYGWYGSRMKPGWYVGMAGANGDGRAYRKVRCMARAKAWVRRRYLNPTPVPVPAVVTRTITAIDHETRTVTFEG